MRETSSQVENTRPGTVSPRFNQVTRAFESRDLLSYENPGLSKRETGFADGGLCSRGGGGARVFLCGGGGGGVGRGGCVWAGGDPLFFLGGGDGGLPPAATSSEASISIGRRCVST